MVSHSYFSSVSARSAPWCETCVAELLSAVLWCQVAFLSGYGRKHVARSMHSAVQRVYGDTVHGSDLTATYVHHTVPPFPLPRCCHVLRVLKHIQGHAHWKGEAYSTWTIPEKASPKRVTGAWCHDFQALRGGQMPLRSGPPQRLCLQSLPSGCALQKGT